MNEKEETKNYLLKIDEIVNAIHGFGKEVEVKFTLVANICQWRIFHVSDLGKGEYIVPIGGSHVTRTLSISIKFKA